MRFFRDVPNADLGEGYEHEAVGEEFPNGQADAQSPARAVRTTGMSLGAAQSDMDPGWYPELPGREHERSSKSPQSGHTGGSRECDP
jgi:hypothetical protein